MRTPLIYTPASRSLATKHPKGFVPPTEDELLELRERVQEFTRREIPEEVAARTDSQNEFPAEMWKKLGDAGLVLLVIFAPYSS
jgi:isovaleryl-CoA dehydrogenase